MRAAKHTHSHTEVTRRHTHAHPHLRQFIANIEKRIAELEDEKAELAECQKLDRQRRALEYLLANRALEKARHALEELGSAHDLANEQAQKLRESVEELQGEQATVADEVSEAKQEVRGDTGGGRGCVSNHAYTH